MSALGDQRGKKLRTAAWLAELGDTVIAISLLCFDEKFFAKTPQMRHLPNSPTVGAHSLIGNDYS
jgi:hypothetical protein